MKPEAALNTLGVAAGAVEIREMSTELLDLYTGSNLVDLYNCLSGLGFKAMYNIYYCFLFGVRSPALLTSWVVTDVTSGSEDLNSSRPCK
eukprot:211098-Amphidinium_carterae.1